MSEGDYWPLMEIRLGVEFNRVICAAPETYWCDGFAPDQYLLENVSPRILGQVWLGLGSRPQEEWVFTLLVDQPARSAAEIDWPALLPPENATRWLDIDLPHKQLLIDPAAALPGGVR